MSYIVIQKRGNIEFVAAIFSTRFDAESWVAQWESGTYTFSVKESLFNMDSEL